MSGKCKFCGSIGYGACSSSPHKKHEHQDDEKYCVYCGSTGYGACSNSPHKTHKHGSGANTQPCVVARDMLRTGI